MPIVRRWLTLHAAQYPQRLNALRMAAVALITLLVMQWASAQQIAPYVDGLTLVSSQRFDRDRTDFVYRIRVINPGGALVGASAFVTSSSASTVILDNEVTIGTLAAGSTFNSTDTFTLRQNRTVPFNPASLTWRILGTPANTRPVANAGPNQTTATGQAVTLDGTGSSDADGNSLTYAWRVKSRPNGSASALSSTSAARPTFRIDRGGTYEFELIVNDGRIDSAPATVQVSTINAKPIANAGADRTVARAARVTLDGSASSDPDFDALNYRWTIVSAPIGSTAAFVDAALVAPVITLDRNGTYRFRLVVSDTRLDSDPDEVVISTENSIPLANAGADQAATLNQRVTLDGSASSDADGDPISFAWSWVSRPAGSAAVLDVTNILRPEFTPDRNGLYTVQLIVNDGLNNSAPDTVTVTVAPPPNRAPNAVADAASTAANTPVDINVLGNDTDPDSDALTIQGFTQPANGSVARSGSLLRFTPSGGFSGSTFFDYTASDGALTATARVTVTINAAANLPPTVNAGLDQVATAAFANARVELALVGSVSDDGKPLPGTLTQGWSLVAGPGPALFTQAAATSTGVQVQAPGVYQFRLTASDGAASASDDVQVEVRSVGNRAPTLAAVADRTLNRGDSLTIQLAGNDPDPFDRLTFSLGAAPAGASVDASGELAWTAGSVGSFPFTVAVRDAAGLSASTSFTATVLAANRPPVFGPLATDQTYVGANYAKLLTATDPDGGAVTFALLGGPGGMTLNGSTLAWRPAASQRGSATVRVQVTDAGGATAAAAFRVDVGTANPPLARDDAYSVQVGQSITIDAPGVLANDSSVDGAPLSALRRSDPAAGTVSAFGANGSFTYTAPAIDPRPAFAITGSILTSDLNVGEDLLDWTPLGDLNRDGRPDLISTRFNGFRLIATQGGSGARLWGVNPACQFQNHDSPADLLADIDDDGRLEYVHAARCAGEGAGSFSAYTRLQALRDDGTVKWTSPIVTAPVTYLPCSAPGVCSTTPVRIEWTDAVRDVILSTARLGVNEAPTLFYRQYVPSSAALAYTQLDDGSYNFKNFGCQAMTGDPADVNRDCMVTVLVSPTDGRVLQALRSAPRRNGSSASNNPYRQNAVVPVDLDGDGTIELVAGADVWRRTGSNWSLAWQSAVEPEQVVVADLDGDGRPEVIHHVNYPETFDAAVPAVDRPAFSGLLVYDRAGVLLRRMPMTTSRSGTLSAADVDGDGLPELLITQGGTAYTFGGDGTLKWTYAVPIQPRSPESPFFRTTDNTNLVAYDLDGDGNREVVLAALGWVLFLDGRTGLEKARFDTGPAPRSDVSGKVFVTDWDDDGHADVIVLNVRGFYSPVFSEAGWVIRSSRNDWLPAPKFQGQFDHRTSSFDQAGRVLFDASAPREFRNPQQLGTVRDPRESAGTSFSYVANDGLVDSAPARVFLAITPANRPPVITSTPPTAFLSPIGREFRVVYRVVATDPDQGDTLTYSVAGFVNLNGIPPPTINATTGEVSQYTTHELDFTSEIFVTVTDSRGATATQSFVLNNAAVGILVPDVVTRSVAGAAATLTASALQYRLAQQQFSAIVPAGSVISQNPVAGATAPRLGTVALVVSKGAQPVAVPGVVGLLQSQANTRLVANGFTTGVITRQFSATVPRGEVIAQSPAAGGEQVPGAVAIVVSAGNGLALRLRSSVTTADAPIPLVAVSQALDGAESPATGLSYSIVPLQAPVGPNPIVTGSNIVPASASRGAFRLTITDGGGRSASADFAVGEPAVAGQAEPMAVAFRRLSSALDDINTLLLQARTALANNDVALQRSLLTQMVLRWRQVDLVDLNLSIALAPETGFAPLVSQMAGFGVNPTADDLIAHQVLADSDADLREWIAALQAPNTPIVELNRLADQFGSRAARLDAVTISEWGHVNNASLYTLILARRIPALYEAIMNELAVVVGLPPTRTAALAAPVGPGLPGDGLEVRRSLFAGLPAATGRGVEAGAGGDAQFNSTLAELAVTQATQWVVDKVIEDFNAKYKAGKQYATDVMTQAFGGAAIVAAVSHLRQFVQGQDTGEIVSGASLSFRLFESPYSFIEGPWDLEDPEMNQVFVIGPQLINDVLPFVTKFQNAMKFRQTLNPLADDGKYKAAKEIKRDLKDFKTALEELKQSTQGLVETIQRIEQTPTGVDRPCLFDASPTCGQLLFDVGFRSVYKYTPPPGFEGFTGLPLPIVFIVYNYRNNTMYFATPPFLPTPAD